MASSGLEWKVGLVIFAAIIIFVGGVIFLGQKEIGKRGPVVLVTFPEVGGLSEGDPVTVSGLKRGSVAGIELGRHEVIVTLQLRPGVILHSDMKISVENVGIMGQKFVAIDPGMADDSFDTNIAIKGGYSPGVTEAIAELGVVLESVGSILARVEGILQEHEVVEPLEETILALRDVSVQLNQILGDNRADIRSATAGFRSVAENLDEMIRANRSLVDTSIATAESAMARLDETTLMLASAAEAMELIVKRVEHGQGTLGKLSRDDKLYKELLLTTQSLNDLVRDIRKNPKRYLKLEVF